jgi:hypothetical protein
MMLFLIVQAGFFITTWNAPENRALRRVCASVVQFS